MWPVCFRSEDSADGQRFVCAHDFVGGPLHTSRHAVRIRGWHAAAAADDVLKEENKQIRARIRELGTEREILRRVAKYFADETNWWAVSSSLRIIAARTRSSQQKRCLPEPARAHRGRRWARIVRAAGFRYFPNAWRNSSTISSEAPFAPHTGTTPFSAATM